MAPAVVVLAHKLALFITTDVAEGRLYEPGLQIVWQYGLKACKDRNGAKQKHECDTGTVSALVIAVDVSGRLCYAKSSNY